jgi:hypothetical protein
MRKQLKLGQHRLAEQGGAVLFQRVKQQVCPLVGADGSFPGCRQTADLPRPLLIIEDAHAQVPDVLRHLGQAMLPGDYLVVEDSLLKQTAILKWAEETPDLFFVDLHYTVFFWELTQQLQ